MPKLEQWEIKKYWQIFCGLHPEDNKLSKQQLDPVFKNSHLADDELDKVWEMADIDEDGQLDFEEFCIAMRLIFDRVNGNITKVPETLPPWLVPGDKRKLVEAKEASRGSTGDYGDSSDDEDYRLSDDFDWYISPTDKNSYEAVYQSAADQYGRITFDSLDGLYKSLKGVPQTDISSAWNLVNPRQSETIDHDQCLVYLHMLNQRSNGKRMPRSVPASLRATFMKEEPSFDPSSHQGDVKTIKATSGMGGFSSYLKQQGLSKTQGADDDLEDASGDWEEVKLKRRLAELDKKLDEAQAAKDGKGSLHVTRYEFEQLLKYKQEEVAEIGKQVDLVRVKGDISEVESQVVQLRGFLLSEESDLANLRTDLSSEVQSMVR